MKELYISNDLIFETIDQACGSDVLALVHFIKNRENVSETEISESLEIPINIIRNMFYRLLNFNLVRFTKKKDKKKGWYIYYWTFLARNVPYAILAMKKKRLEGLKSRMEREQNNTYFICNDNHFKLDFDGATEFDFRCPECGELVYQIDNHKIMQDLLKEVDELNDYIQNPPSIFVYEEEPIDKLEIVTEEEEKAARKRTKKTTKKATKKAVKKPAKKVTKKATKKAVKKPAKKVTKKATKKAVKKPAKKVSKKATKKTVNKSTKKVTKKSAKKSTKKVAKKAVKKSTKKVTKKATKKAAKKTSKKATRKATKKTAAKKTVLSSRKKKSLAKSVLSKRKKK